MNKTALYELVEFVTNNRADYGPRVRYPVSVTEHQLQRGIIIQLQKDNLLSDGINNGMNSYHYDITTAGAEALKARGIQIGWQDAEGAIQ